MVLQRFSVGDLLCVTATERRCPYLFSEHPNVGSLSIIRTLEKNEHVIVIDVSPSKMWYVVLTLLTKSGVGFASAGRPPFDPLNTYYKNVVNI